MLHHFRLAPNHHAVTSLQAPDTAACSHVHIVDLFMLEFLGTPNVVNIVGIAAVDKDISGSKIRYEVRYCLVDGGRRDHQPHCPRLLQFLHQIPQVGGSGRFLAGQFLHGFLRPVEDHTLMTSF